METSIILLCIAHYLYTFSMVWVLIKLGDQLHKKNRFIFTAFLIFTAITTLYFIAVMTLHFPEENEKEL